MTNSELIQFLENTFPSKKAEEINSHIFFHIDAGEILTVSNLLKDNAQAQFDFLFCQTAIDKRTHFELVYSLRSTVFHHNICIKVIIEDRESPEIESVINIWQAAELYECEIFDLFGIKFKNHDSLRRIFLGDEWKGYPLRKDYKDDVNVLSL